MGLFNKALESKKTCLYLTEDYRGILVKLPLRRKMLVMDKDDKPYMAWPYHSGLLVPLKIKGPKDKKPKDFGLVYPISARNAVLDPCGITGESLKGKTLWTWMKGVALEEFHVAREKKLMTAMEKATFPLAIAATVQVILIALAIVAKMYYD